MTVLVKNLNLEIMLIVLIEGLVDQSPAFKAFFLYSKGPRFEMIRKNKLESLNWGNSFIIAVALVINR